MSITAEMIEEGAAPPALEADGPAARAIIDFIQAYFVLWNAKDAAQIWARIYRLDPGHRIQSEADLAALLASTVAAGWDQSTLDSISIHEVDATAWLARIGYTRRTASGEVLPPANRLGAYIVRQTGDGLRITGLPLAGRPLRPAS